MPMIEPFLEPYYNLITGEIEYYTPEQVKGMTERGEKAVRYLERLEYDITIDGFIEIIGKGP